LSDHTPATQQDYSGLHGAIVALLEAGRRAAARSINALMTAVYWEIGRRIVEFEQGGQDRAAYGDTLISRLGEDLSCRFGRDSVSRISGACAPFTWPGRARPSRTTRRDTPKRADSLHGVGRINSRRDRLDSVGSIDGLLRLAQAFPLHGPPTCACWRSKARKPAPFTRPKRCAAAGRCASSTARSAVSSMSAQRSRATKRPCSSEAASDTRRPDHS